MQKYLLLLVAFCLQMVSQGQTTSDFSNIDLSGLPQPTTAKALRYWFDEDAVTVNTIMQFSGQQVLDVSALTEGLHTLHYQIIDNTDAVAVTSSVLFMKVGDLSTAASAVQMRYWYDDDVAGVQTISSTSGIYPLDVSALIEGLHTLHFQIVDNMGTVTVPRSSVFIKVANPSDDATAKQLRYWFDDDAQAIQTVAASVGMHTVETQLLVEGLHTLHYQVVGTDGIASNIASALFMKVGEHVADGELTARMLMYWFDDETTVKTVDMEGGVQILDAAELVDGLHTVHYQVLCSNGQMTTAVSSVFLRMNFDEENTTAQSMRYWFDNEQTAFEVALTDDIQMLDASRLEEGLHTVHYQIVDNKGVLGTPVSTVFLKMDSQETDAQAKLLRYWFDEDLTVTESALAVGTQTLDASKLVDGLHTVHYQIVDDNGTVSTPVSTVFLKMNAQEAVAQAKNIRYWFDDDAASAKIAGASNGAQVLDVEGLLPGLHIVYYQIVAADGKVSPPVASIFMRDFVKLLADGENGITRYQYWLNDNSQAMQTVSLEEATNPYQLIALLPMQKEPIRSQQFRFEMTDGQPTIYAENTFHVRFHDAADYFVDSEKAFVDYSVKQDINDVIRLESGIRQTTVKPTGNDIKWYQLDAEPGDSVQFRLDHAATVQLFAPSGEELFSASGSESVGWGGCHTRESGTYYLALHDVTANYGNTISIDYNHIDKYAVLRQDVAVVGNGGCSTITFEGNGFRDLYAVDLYNAQGDTIHYVYIGHESDAVTSVVFDFTDAVLGTYHAKFRFADEDKLFVNLVSVEEARDIELATTVTYPSTFLRGTSTTYTIKITNKGNMTAYAVPLEMHILSDNYTTIEEIIFDGYIKGTPLPEILYSDSIDDEAIEILMDYYRNTNGLSQFVVYHDSIGKKDFALSHAILTIPPYSTKQLTVKVKSSSSLTFETYTNKDWFPLILTRNLVANSKMRSKSMRESMCCMRTKVECVADIIVNVATPFMPPGANCLTSLSKTGLETLYDVWCSEGANMAERFDNYLKSEGQNLANRLLESAISCITGYYGKWLKELKDDRVMAAKIGNVMEVERISSQIQNVKDALNGALKALYDGLSTMVLGKGCYDAFTKPLPDCPPNPDGGGGSSKPVNSMDPNDIYGYTAESTSKAVMDGLTDVYYRIEFENDTTFATAAAHDIYVTDTLDATKFDLSTFAPTHIIIGDKSAELTGDKNFVTTIDMRPGINAIAQVEGTFDNQKGIAKWHISSLDPMTMEPTTFVMDGVLPVNTNGQGIGEVSYDIKLKDGLAHGTEVNNRASIVFDTNEPIMTPTWTNVIDRIAPESHVTDVKMLNDSTAAVSIEATDELSGPWRYDVYVQYGSGAWFLEAENVPIDKTANVKVYEGINHGFYVVVTDSAGNVEQKEAAREYTFEVFAPQVDTNTKLQLAQGWNWVSHNQQEALSAETLKPKAQRIMSQTDELYKDSRFGWTGTLDELLPTQMYKVQMAEADEVQLSGRLFNAAFRAVPLYAGWNWIGYPVAQTMTPAEALQRMEAEEDDAIIGRDGLATYSDGEWTGTLAEMVPGQGYMYRSASEKSLFLNATAQASSRAVHRSRTMADGQWPEDWTVDRQRYPNVMGMVAELWQDGKPVEDSSEWLLGAFCDGECRGLAETVGRHLMMNVYGRGGEKIEFFVMHRESGEILPVSESEEFRVDLLGTVRQPYQLNMGVLTGISDATRLNNNEQINNNWYDLQGRRISVSSASSENSVLPKGVYIVTDGQKKGTQKVVRK